MKKILLFDNELVVKDYLCSSDPKLEIKSNPSLRLYIKITDGCNADCKFCANKGCEDFGNLDLNKLEFVIRYLVSKKILHSIAITGGEPMVNPDKVNNLLNMIYSIDKLRLKTYINFQQFKDLEEYINIYFKSNIKKFWLSDKKSSFHYNYNIEIEEGKSFIFQYIHNNENINYNDTEKTYNFTIEFNPNKLKDNFLLLHILDSFSNWFLRSFDLAIDIPINILDLVIDKSGKRKFFMQSYGSDNITYYIGTKEKDGSLRIYNKKKESDLSIVRLFNKNRSF